MNALLLLGAHMLGDYILQTNTMAAKKLVDWRVRTVHVTAYTLGFVPFVLWGVFGEALTPGRAAGFLLSLFVTHWITDCRRWASGEKWPPKPILVDQTIHVLTIGVLAACFSL